MGGKVNENILGFRALVQSCRPVGGHNNLYHDQREVHH